MFAQCCLTYEQKFANMIAKGSLSIIWAAITMANMLMSTKPIKQAADLIIDLCICASAVFTFTYPICMDGPLRWWIIEGSDLHSNASQVIWELVGLVSVGILE